MRPFCAFCVALLAGALVVSGQEDPDLAREVERLTALLEARAARARPPEAQLPVLRVYDVSDLLAEIDDQTLAPTNVFRSKTSLPEPEEIEINSPIEIDMLIELVKFTVEPATWDLEGADIAPKGTRLLVRTLPRVHEGIDRLFRMLRADAFAQVRVEIVAVPVPEAEAAALALRPRDLDPEHAKTLLAQEPLGRVRILCRDGQQAVQRSGALRSYLHDYDVEIAQAATIGDPARRELFEGFAAEVRPLLDRGANGVLLHLRIERTRAGTPMRAVKTEHGPVELPDMTLTRVNTSLWAPLGRTVVAGGCTAGDEPCVFLVTAAVAE